MNTNHATPTDLVFDLPEWMQPHRRVIDWGLLLIFILSLLAAQPFIIRAGLPRETDAELHVFRTAELIYCIQHGELYPRWAPNFWYGYGYPFFNYYGSFTYYLAAGVGLLTGVGAVGGARFVFVLGQLMAGICTYAFVRRRWNAAAGIVAGVVYVYSPYIVLIDPHMRGDMAESFALGLLPALLWAFDRVLTAGHWHHIIIAAGLLAASICTHNLMALVGFGLLLGWLVWLRVFVRMRGVYRWRLTWLTLALGVLLASFFWLPVVFESGAVQLDRLIGPGHFDYKNHFLSLGQLLAPAPRLDLGAANPAYAFNLGLAAWGLALLGCVALLFRADGVSKTRRAATLAEWQRRVRRGYTEELDAPLDGVRDLAYFAVAGLLFIFLMLPASAFVWRAVPYMPILQFPWRVLGAASFCLAVLAGAATRWLARLPTRARPAALGLLVIAPLLGAMPVLYPPEWDADFGPTTPAAYIDFELSGVALGTTSGGEYLPVTVTVPPAPQPSLLESYARPGLIDKVNRATLPAATTVTVVSHGPTEDRFWVKGTEDFLLRLYTFAFPGWCVEIDGQAVGYAVGEPEGFIVVEVPGGTHQVRVFLDTTLPRNLASGLSLAALVGLVSLAVIVARQAHPPERLAPRLSQHAALSIAAVGVLFIGVRLVSDSHPGQFYVRTAPGAVPLRAGQSYRQSFTENIDLLAYDLPRASARPGASLSLTLYWYGTAPIEENYQVFVHLVPLGSDSPVAQSDKLNPGDLPTTRWTPDRYVRDAHTVTLPTEVTPGQYLLLVGLYDRETGERIPTAGTPPDDKVVLPVFIEVLPK